MFTEKYKPKKIKEIIGNKSQIKEIENWLNKPEKALFVYGKNGTGKSIAIELLAKKYNFELIKSYANEKRGYKELQKTIFESIKQQSLIKKNKLIVIDDIELIDSTKAIIEIIKTSKFPVVIIGTNPYESKLHVLRKYCKLIKFNSIRTEQIKNFLVKICIKENIKFEEKASNQLSRMCDGDLRACLNDLETLSEISIKSISDLSSRNQMRDIFNTLKIIFKTKNIKNSHNALINSDKSPDDIISWLEENIPNEYEDIEEIYKAYEYLSKADLFLSRNQKKFYIEMGIYGICLSKKESYIGKFTRYVFPKFIRKKPLQNLSEKISKVFHISKRKTSDYLNLLSLVINDDIIKKFSLEKKDIELLNQIKNNLSPTKR